MSVSIQIVTQTVTIKGSVPFSKTVSISGIRIRSATLKGMVSFKGTTVFGIPVLTFTSVRLMVNGMEAGRWEAWLKEDKSIDMGIDLQIGANTIEFTGETLITTEINVNATLTITYETYAGEDTPPPTIDGIPQIPEWAKWALIGGGCLLGLYIFVPAFKKKAEKVIGV